MWFCYLKKRPEAGDRRPEGSIRRLLSATAGSSLQPTAYSLFLAILALLGLPGCATLNPQPPVEHFANKLADEAIIPAVREGLSQGVEQLVIQAGAQGFNPTYVVRFSGKWVTGVEGAASVGVEGIAGQLQVTSASNEETESSPYRKEQTPPPPTSQPARTEPRTSVEESP